MDELEEFLWNDDEYLSMEQNSNTWEEFRDNSLRFGASTIGALLGFSRQSRENFLLKYKERVLAINKEKWEERRIFNGNECTRFGHDNELKALNCFYDYLKSDCGDLEIRKIGSFLGLLPDEQNLFCSPDAFAFWCEASVMYGVEIKCPFNPKNIPATINDINPLHLTQCIQCLHLTGAKAWYLVYHDPRDGDMVVFLVQKNRPVWKIIKEKANECHELMRTDGSYSKKMDTIEKKYHKTLLYDPRKLKLLK